MDQAADHLPEQQTGSETNFTAEAKYPDLRSAHQAFTKAAERLLDVNHWHDHAGAGSSRFQLCDQAGRAITGPAKTGLHISIELPGPVPGPDAGDGKEWVVIGDLRSGGDGHSAEAYLLLTVRPVHDPTQNEAAIAHFYGAESTSTFIIRRDGLTVSAGAHGRNETANTEQADLHDQVRNVLISTVARIGLSGGQWQKLVNGMIG